MGPAAAGVGLSATGLSAFGALSGASTAAQGDMLEAQNAANAAEIGQTKAAETDADMTPPADIAAREHFNAIRAGAGLNPNSPTGAAIGANVEGVANLSRTQAVDNIQTPKSQIRRTGGAILHV